MINRRLFALLIKESTELLRNRQLVIFLTIAPVISMVIFGYVMNSNVTNLRLSILDQSQVTISRDFVDAFTANRVFLPTRHTNSQQTLTQQVERGEVDAGLIIPPSFDRDLLQTGKSEVQVVVDGINAYSSGLAKGYVSQITTRFNLDLLQRYQPVSTGLEVPVQAEMMLRYNPGMLDSWFFVPGVLGAIITLSAILAAAVEAVREKDQGTLEQLLMTPVASTYILISKIVPISALLTGTLLICFLVAHWVFALPFRGNLFLLLLFSILYIQIGVAIGLAISTFSENKLQTILIGIFLNIPIILLGGAVTAVNSMPLVFRWIGQINPLYHYLIILRSILLKGAGSGSLGFKRDRYAHLAIEGAETKQRYEVARTTYNTAKAALQSRLAAVEAAQTAVNIAQGKLTQAKTTTLNPGRQQTNVSRFETQAKQAHNTLAAAQADVKTAIANQQLIQNRLNNLTVKSPIDGVITTRSVEPGTVVLPSRPLLRVVDLSQVYLRGFIPGRQIAQVRVGQLANVYLDNDPKHQNSFKATVTAIDSKASFTPENVYFQSDRVQQVFGVKLNLEQPGRLAKPGMPADGEIPLH